jgi:mannose-1-phosphate guanylyltransferase
MIQATYQRVCKFTTPEKIFIVTHIDQVGEVSKLLPGLKKENIIVEPMMKNTAPCIGLSALFIHHLDPEAVMLVVPADHLITNENRFIELVGKGAEVSINKNCLVTIGISPTRPETGYGYIQFDPNLTNGISYKVKTFAEKPNRETAERFLASGDFLWNSGMFIWKVSTILRQIEEHLPELYESLMDIDRAMGKNYFRSVLETAYSQIKSISIDYGVMETSREVYVLKGDFGWSDVGNWEEVYNLHPKDEEGNVNRGNNLLVDTKNSFVDSSEKSVVTLGLENVIVVETEDVILIARKERSQDIKEVVEQLKRKNMTHLL